MPRGDYPRGVAPAIRFWSRVDKQGPIPLVKGCPVTPCWIHDGGVNADGYPRWWFNGAAEPVYWYAYRQKYGRVPKGFELHHKCENRRCVNPTHLQAVKHRDHVSGEGYGNTRITRRALLHICNLRTRGLSARAIAAKTAVSKSQVLRILSGEQRSAETGRV